MNAHSWARASVPEKIAVPKLRAGFTDVLSTGIVARWIIAEREAGGEAAEADRVALRRRRQHDEDQQGGEHDLDDDHRAEPERAADVGAPAVGGEDARVVEVARAVG